MSASRAKSVPNAPRAKNALHVKSVPLAKSVHRVKSAPLAKSVHRVKSVQHVSRAKTAAATVKSARYVNCASHWMQHPP
ncbi:hypothetical protein D3C76_765090 [compost metagenome]